MTSYAIFMSISLIDIVYVNEVIVRYGQFKNASMFDTSIQIFTLRYVVNVSKVGVTGLYHFRTTQIFDNSLNALLQGLGAMLSISTN